MPVTVPLYSGVTLAVKVTACPEFDGFGEDVKVVAVEALSTTWLTTFDVLPAYVESPLYLALMLNVPAASVEVLKLAEPLLRLPVPNVVEPFRNATVSPSGGAGVTTAVKVTACP